jgi:hypothetical protein
MSPGSLLAFRRGKSRVSRRAGQPRGQGVSAASDVQIDGASLNASALSSDPKKTEIQHAIRFDKAVIVKFVAR